MRLYVATRFIRTALEIANDVLQSAEIAGTAREKDRRRVPSQLNARVLAATQVASSVEEAIAIRGFRPFPARGGIVTNELIDKLRDDNAG